MFRYRIAIAGVALLALYACSDQQDPSALAPSEARLRADPAEVKAHRGQKIPDQYIVVLNDGVDPAAVLGRHADLTPLHVYGAAIRGFNVKLNRGQLQKLQRDADVSYIEEDGVISIAQDAQGAPPPAGGSIDDGPRGDAFQSGAPWGLSKLDQHFGSASDGFYDYTARGTGVKAYVLDTGINIGHNDFDGAALNRAKAGTLGFDAFGGNGQDCNGHGTHVTGTIIGTTYGVAKAATAYSVRVLDCAGNGSWGGYIAGVDWIAHNHVKPAVANASLTGGFVQAANDATRNLVLYGVPIVVAAGNAASDANFYSPASEPTAITVAASDINNARAGFSNYGSVVDLYAPGVGVLSAWIGSATATATLNGTSMASPHVAGLVALQQEQNKTAGPQQLADAIIDTSVPGVITGNVGATPNRLAHFLGTWCLGAGATVYPIDNSPFGSAIEYYFSNSSGTHHGWMNGTTGIDFDLYLEKWNGSTWVTVQSKAGTAPDEIVKYNGTSGYYRYRVVNASTSTTCSSTSGSFDLHYERPA